MLVYEQRKSRYICRKTNTGPEFGVFTKSIVICPGLEGVDSSGRWGAKLGRAVAVNQWVNNSAVQGILALYEFHYWEFHYRDFSK